MCASEGRAGAFFFNKGIGDEIVYDGWVDRGVGPRPEDHARGCDNLECVEHSGRERVDKCLLSAETSGRKRREREEIGAGLVLVLVESPRVKKWERNLGCRKRIVDGVKQDCTLSTADEHDVGCP